MTMGWGLQAARPAQTRRLPGIHVAPTDKGLPIFPTLPLPILPYASMRVRRREWVVLAIFPGKGPGDLFLEHGDDYWSCSLSPLASNIETQGSSKCFILAKPRS